MDPHVFKPGSIIPLYVYVTLMFLIFSFDCKSALTASKDLLCSAMFAS